MGKETANIPEPRPIGARNAFDDGPADLERRAALCVDSGKRLLRGLQALHASHRDTRDSLSTLIIIEIVSLLLRRAVAATRDRDCED